MKKLLNTVIEAIFIKNDLRSSSVQLFEQFLLSNAASIYHSTIRILYKCAYCYIHAVKKSIIAMVFSILVCSVHRCIVYNIFFVPSHMPKSRKINISREMLKYLSMEIMCVYLVGYKCVCACGE